MGEWKVYRIDDLGEINRGKSKHRPRNDSILFGGEYPFIQTGDVKKAHLYITEYDTTYSDVGLAQSKLWPKGTLCITIAANIAESAILGIDACFPDSVVGFTPYENKSDLKFIKYLLDEFKVYMQQISKGTTQDNLSLEKLRRVKFNAPDYETQVKIADILSKYDDLIENNNKRIKILEQMAENLYKEWFVRFRFPGYEDVEFENGLPKGWRQIRLGEIALFIRGKSYSSGDIQDGDNILLSMNNIRPYGGFIRDFTRVYGGAYQEKHCIKYGDLLMSITDMTQDRRIIGYVAMFDSNRTDCIMSTHLMKIDTKLNHMFILNFFNVSGLSKMIAEFATGANVLGLTETILSRIKATIPPTELINLYGETVESYYDMITVLRNENENLIKQRDMLLPRLMSGKLEV